MSKQISSERQLAYYAGMIMIIVGFLMFLSSIVAQFNNSRNFASVGAFGEVGGMSGFGGSGNFASLQVRPRSDFTFTLIGFGLMAVGGFVMKLGAKGLAGSGVLLDPEQARTDLEPYSRMAGGMIKDGLDEANINLGAKPEKVIMIRCQSCETLNQETAKFCQECGKPV